MDKELQQQQVDYNVIWLSFLNCESCNKLLGNKDSCFVVRNTVASVAGNYDLALDLARRIPGDPNLQTEKHLSGC